MFHDGIAEGPAARHGAMGVGTVVGDIDLDLDVLTLWESGAWPELGLLHYPLNPWMRAFAGVLRRALGH
jgi:hypothetical protein